MADKKVKVQTLVPHIGAYENEAGTHIEVTEEQAKRFVEKGYVKRVTATKKTTSKEGE